MQRKFELMLSQFKIHENLLNSGLYCHFTNIVFLKSEIKLNVFMIDKEKGNLEDNLHIVIDQINWILGNMDYIEDEIRRSHLIDLKNNNWLEEGENKISLTTLIIQ